jgi:hypothetical protein
MAMLRIIALTLTLATASPALAADQAAATTPDRGTAVSTLAGLYYSADACEFSISRDKVNAYRDVATPAGDAMFNVDVFRATQDLYTQHKDWPAEQLNTWCASEAAIIKSLGMML